MYSLTRHSRRVALLRPVSSSILYGPVATIRSVTKDIQEDNLLETHAHNAALRADVKKLGKMLGDAISKHSGEGVFLKVEKLRHQARLWRQGEGGLQALNDTVAQFSVHELNDVSRAFAHFLTLANTAETHNKVRALRQELLSATDEVLPVPKRKDSTLGTIEQLLGELKVSPEAIYDKITTLKMELVLTAHPTEVNRRTFLNKHKQLANYMEKLNFQYPTPYERLETERALQGEITNIWNSDVIRRIKPSPVDEAKGGLAVVEQVLWDAVPRFMRKLDAILELTCKKKLPITAAPVKFASWMGGDRDGNPNVTPTITWTVALRSRWQALRLLRKDVRELKMVLSSTSCSDELRKVVGDSREPYRHVMKELEAKIEATISTIDSLFNPDGRLKPGVKIPELPIHSTSQVLEPLLLLYRSLEATGQHDIAEGLLTDTIRRLYTFGVTLLPLDIRQESTRHTETVDAITRFLGIGAYSQWDEGTRMSWLMTELNGKRPLLPKERPLSELNLAPEVIDCLETFRLIAEMGEESLGAYVISMAQRPSDVLAVKLLMKEFGLKRPMRVVPLFETLDDLNRSVETMETLFTNPWYKGHIDGKQEIMIGYSDSSKDAGRLAALWAQYEAQEKLANLAERYGVEVTFFHGKGGTVSRGGNPSMYKALIAQPPKTLQGRLRITEQGEMVTQNFGHMAVAEATLDVYTAGVLMEGFQKVVNPGQKWRDVMALLSDKGRHHYHATVRHDPIFVPYFRAATPEQELGTANIGSRPQKRRPGGVETLRAIPWVFSWTQTRLHLSAWLGVGEALEDVAKSHGDVLDEMYREWPYFNTNLDLVDMILAKAEADIAENYDKLLVTDPDQKKLGEKLRERLKLTTKAVLNLSGNKKLQQNNPVLQWAIIMRNIYADPLNVLQAHVLKRLRNKEYSSEEERQKLQDALVVTINGISAGMRNSDGDDKSEVPGGEGRA